ncbi:MAG TPA: hypothetical protein VGV14_19090 [Rhodanobacter sp.]|nr:hypothetical protein [Rhodanobacter sp.]
MQLNELIISRNRYNFEHQGTAAGGISGRIAFSDVNKCEVTLVLRPDHIDKILAIVAQSMVDTTRELVTELTTNVIEHAAQTPALALDAA